MKRCGWCAVFMTVSVWARFAAAQALEVNPPQVLEDEVAVVRATGLKPAQHVMIQAQLVDGDDHPWASQAEFVADANGVVDTSTQAPVKGSYRVVSAMGLVWSMMSGAKDAHVYRAQNELAPQTITFHLLVDGREAASSRLQQLAVSAGVHHVKVEGTLHGQYFGPDGEGKHAAVLVLGGSEGGTPVRRAAWLASHGYAALALCYFHCEGRPDQLQNIPLEYFGAALVWLTERPEVDAKRLGVLGASRGGELALQLGSMFPSLKAVVAYVPANVRYPACCGIRPPQPSWTWHGQPLAFAAPWQHGNLEQEVHATIHVEQTQGDVLMIAGEDDGVWPSSGMVTKAAERLRSAHFAHTVVVLKYQHAGHRAGMPAIVPAWVHGMTHPVAGTPMDPGGTPEGNAESSLDAIPKVLKFLNDSLGEKAPAAETTKPAR